MTHAAESLHWYARDGSPAYTVRSRDGSERPATLRDARKLNLLPSVTSIIKCAAAPGLELWKANQLMMAALTLPRLQDEPEKDWLARVVRDSKEHAKNAAERGTGIHAAIQGFYEGEGVKPGYQDHIRGAVAAVAGWAVGGWKAEQSFAHSLGFGGKVDLSAASGQHLLDFKSKEFDEKTDLKTWDEHAMQLAAYREGLGMGMARCAIVYVSVTTPGLSKLIEIPEEELSRGWEMFVFLLSYWKAKNKYRCAWQELEAA
jgi:hypothetical protein